MLGVDVGAEPGSYLLADLHFPVVAVLRVVLHQEAAPQRIPLGDGLTDHPPDQDDPSGPLVIHGPQLDELAPPEPRLDG